MSDDFYMGNVDVFICFNEMCADDGAEDLWRSDGMLFSEDVDGVFDGVRSNDNAVVSFRVATDKSLVDGNVPRCNITHETSISPSRRQQMVISTTV